MFSVNPKGAIYSDTDMGQLIKGTSKKTERDKETKKMVPKWPIVHNQPRVAIQRMRSVVGTFLYLKEKKVNEIFIKQVDRIGAQLEIMEHALSKTPRTMKKGGRGTGEDVRIVTFTAWTPLDLKKKWFEYMDVVYKQANEKGLEFMEKNTKRLKEEFTDAKKIKQKDVDDEKTQDAKDKKANEKKLRDDMPGYIKSMEEAWKKAKDWPKPKWNQ
jgi:hypothetical protein